MERVEEEVRVHARGDRTEARQRCTALGCTTLGGLLLHGVESGADPRREDEAHDRDHHQGRRGDVAAAHGVDGPRRHEQGRAGRDELPESPRGGGPLLRCAMPLRVEDGRPGGEDHRDPPQKSDELEHLSARLPSEFEPEQIQGVPEGEEDHRDHQGVRDHVGDRRVPPEDQQPDEDRGGADRPGTDEDGHRMGGRHDAVDEEFVEREPEHHRGCGEQDERAVERDLHRVPERPGRAKCEERRLGHRDVEAHEQVVAEGGKGPGRRPELGLGEEELRRGRENGPDRHQVPRRAGLDRRHPSRGHRRRGGRERDEDDGPVDQKIPMSAGIGDRERTAQERGTADPPRRTPPGTSRRRPSEGGAQVRDLRNAPVAGSSVQGGRHGIRARRSAREAPKLPGLRPAGDDPGAVGHHGDES